MSDPRQFLRLGLVASAVFAGCVTEVPRAPVSRGDLRVVAVSECARPPSPDGLSGVTHLEGNSFLSIEDSGGRLWPLAVEFDEDGTVRNCKTNPCIRLDGVIDGEGCAWDPLRKTIWVSDETGPFVSEHDPATGRRLGALQLTPDFSRIRKNRGPEGLTISPDGCTLWTCTEESVEGDGPLASMTNGSPVRLHRYSRSGAAIAWAPAEEIPYLVDPLGGRPYGTKSRSGVSGLCALSDGTLLVLEREFSVKELLPSFRLRLYAVRGREPKKLILDRDTGLSMYEGICLASESSAGEVRLLLVSDGDGLAAETLLSIVLSRE